MSEPTDYAMTKPRAAEIVGALVAVPGGEGRRRLAHELTSLHGRGYLLDLLCDVIGMANAVVANNREMIEQVLLERGDWAAVHPPHPINLPTMLGAVQGVILARGISPERTCGGCAFRQGTCANTLLTTTTDARDCMAGAMCGNDVFHCHETLDEKGQPTEPCRGWAQATAAQRKAAE